MLTNIWGRAVQSEGVVTVILEVGACPHSAYGRTVRRPVLLKCVRILQILRCSENSVSFSIFQVKFESLKSSEGHDLIRWWLFIY